MQARPGIFLHPRFHTGLNKLRDVEVARVEAALQKIPDGFGQPHTRSGISIRRLRKNVFEWRAGLKLRLRFRENAGGLEFFLVGDQDDVQIWLRNF